MYHIVKNFLRKTVRLKIVDYNGRHKITRGDFIMRKRTSELTEVGKTFGERLSRFRQSAGYSQRAFATEVGISQRMVVYYEKECERIPIKLLPLFAKALGVSADQLLGMKKENVKHRDNRLWRRFSQVEKLPPNRRRPVVQLLDAFLKGEKVGNG